MSVLPLIVRNGILAAGLAALLISPVIRASAGEPEESPELMHAVLAKVWGTTCPGMLEAEEVAEVQDFIVRWVAAARIGQRGPRVQPISYEQVAKSLERSYLDKYQEPGMCDTLAPDAARELLEQIRLTDADPAFWAELRGDGARG